MSHSADMSGPLTLNIWSRAVSDANVGSSSSYEWRKGHVRQHNGD